MIFLTIHIYGIVSYYGIVRYLQNISWIIYELSFKVIGLGKNAYIYEFMCVLKIKISLEEVYPQSILQ